MSDEVSGYCTEAGCEAGRGGDCIENLTIAECRHFVVGEPEEEAIAQLSPAPSSEEVQPIPVRAGGSFTVEEVDRFLRQTAGRVQTVAIVGDPEAGKTSLISSLYEMIRAGRLSLGFAGSATLRGFEQRCHLARTKSGRTEAATQRTRLGERLSFLHLDVIQEDDERCHLIVADRAGEDYEVMLDRPDAASALMELQRFDTIVVLVDGTKLLDVVQRQGQIARARRLWLALDNQGLLAGSRQYQMVLTKSDEFGDGALGQVAKDLFASLSAELERRFPDARITAFEVAAMPPRSGGVPYGLGMEALVRSWLRAGEPEKFHSPIRKVVSTSPFDRMTVRFSPGQSAQ